MPARRCRQRISAEVLSICSSHGVRNRGCGEAAGERWPAKVLVGGGRGRSEELGDFARFHHVIGWEASAFSSRHRPGGDRVFCPSWEPAATGLLAHQLVCGLLQA